MKTLDHIVKRIAKLAYQKRDVMCKLVHLENSFETHNDRVEAEAEMYIVTFKLCEDKQHIDVTIVDYYAEKIVQTLIV